MIVLLIILTLILLLSLSSVVITCIYDDGADNILEMKIRWLFIRLYPNMKKNKKIVLKEKKPKTEKPKGESKSDGGGENSEEDGDDEEVFFKQKDGKTKTKEKNPFPKPKVDFAMIKDFITGASNPIRRFVGRIRITDFYLDYVVGGNDAAQAALSYGASCAVVYSVLTWLDEFLILKVREINMEADFDKPRNDLFCYFKVKLSLGTMITCVLWILWRVFRLYSGVKKGKKKRKAK